MGWKDYLKTCGFAVDASMQSKIDEWYAWYTATDVFYSSEEQGTDGRTYKVDRLTIKPARMVCQEFASLILNERTMVACDDEATNQWLALYLSQTGFFATGQRLIERAFAVGTAAWALRVEGIGVDALTSPGARIVPQRFDARHITPLSYDEDTCTECAFRSTVTVKGVKLEQVQLHQLIGGIYVVKTAFFNDKGAQVVVPGIAPEMNTKSATPLFALVRPGLENTHADYSPYGVSVFDDAIGAVKLVDAAVDNMYKDIWLGQKMLFLDERLLDADKNGNVRVPRAKDQQLFRKAEGDVGTVESMVEDYNPDLRVTDNRLAIQTGLELLGARTGLGADYFALDGASALKTATEVVSEQSDLFRSIRKHENALAPAIQTIMAGILSLARTVKGLPIPEDVGDIRVTFDDSVIEDADAQRKRDLADIAAGIMHPWEYRMKWYGEDEVAARKMTDTESIPPTE